MKRRSKPFVEQLDSSAANFAICEYHRMVLSRVLVDPGLKGRAAAGAATKETADHFKTTVRTVQRALKRWPAQWLEMKQAADADANFKTFRQRANHYQAITAWFSAEEFESIREMPMAEQALAAIPRATARARELEQTIVLQKKLAAKLFGQIQQLEVKLKRSQMAEAVRIAVDNSAIIRRKLGR